MRMESDDEAEQSQAEKLYMFLYYAKAHHRAPELSLVFNAEFPFEKGVEANMSYLDKRDREYADKVSANVIMLDGERYVHISDFSAETVVKRKVNRCLEKMPSFVSRKVLKCPIHSKRCRLLRYLYGFLCFLHLLTEDSEPAKLPTTVAPFEDEGGDEEVAIDLAEERALVLSSVSTSQETALTITPIEDVQNNERGDLPLSCFPCFPMVGDLHYVLLTDIMHLFNIREDYCLSAISSYSEADMNWVEEGQDHHLLADSAWKDSEYRTGKDIIKSIFDEWGMCEAQLPSEEEHADATHRLGLAYMGKFQQPTEHQEIKSTISLWSGPMLEADENQQVLFYLESHLYSFCLWFFSCINLIVLNWPQVFVYDDSFLRRAGGSRSNTPSSSNSARYRQPDAALAHYIKKFNHQKVQSTFIHKQYDTFN